MSKGQTLLRAGVPSLSPGPGLKQEITETPQIKEEPEEQSVKQEEEQLPVSASEIITICVKREEFSLLQQRQTAPETSASVNNEHMPGTEGKKHQCPFCNKRFRRKQKLQRHIQIHIGQRPYSCTVCMKTFAKKYCLKIHMRTHTVSATEAAEMKKHQCYVCNKRFWTKSKLQRHIQVHTGEKPYSCSLCAKTFAQKPHLDRHMKTHKGDKTFSCSICELDFTVSSFLKEHLKTHKEEKPSSFSGSLFERRTAESEEELCGSTEENQRKQQLLDSARGPRVLLPRAGVPSLSPGPGLNQEITETPQIKEEPEEQSVKQEEEQLPVSASEIITICVKEEEASGEDISSETEGHTDTDNDDDWKPLSQSAAKSTGLFPKYKSAPETSAAVNNGLKSGAEGAEGKKRQCSVCKKRFKTKRNLQIHYRVHTGERPYSCTVCKKTFTVKSYLRIHMITHKGAEGRKHQCSVCNKRFKTKQHLQIHNRVHTGEKPFNCSLCTKSFAQRHHLNTHMKTHRGDITFNCSICEMDFTDSSSLKEHLKTHTEEKPSSCRDSLFERRTAESEEELCGSKEENQRKQQLLDSAHGPRVLLPRAGVPSLSPGPGLTTEITETPQIKEEPEEQSVKQEEAQLPVSASEIITVCVKEEESSLLQQRQTESSLETSASVKNGHMSGADGAELKNQCSVCNKTFANKRTLQDHNKIHTGERPYSCTVCTKTFRQKGHLKTHVNIHRGAEERKQQCSVCSKTFRTKRSLQRHISTHTGERPFGCTVCEKSFPSKDHLQSHMRAHRGTEGRKGDEQKKQQCSVCNKKFRTKWDLQVHMRIHTGEKPFSCSVCTKTFAQKSQLDKHMKTHRDITLSCSICEMDFTDSSSLKEHLKTHTEEKPSSCLSSLFERRTAESEEELCGSKEENQRKQQLLDSAHGPRVLLPRAGVPSLSPGPGLNQEITETPQIKEEPVEQSVKQEEEQLPVSASEMTICEKEEETPLLQQRQTESGHTPGAVGAEGKKNQCSFCNKRFSNKAHLKRHSRVHTGERPFSCAVCKKPFTTKGNLQSHMRTHRGAEEKTHQCSVCNKRFWTKHDLKRHNKVHTGM